MTYTPYKTIAFGWSDTQGSCDVRISASGAGRGRVVIDRTPGTMFLIALGSDRRARGDDRIPGTLGGVAPGGLFARRGWPGDALRTDGQRTGCRLWLLADAKQTEATRLAALQYADEAVGQIASDHGHTYALSAVWTTRGRLQVTAAALGTTVSTPVALGSGS